MSKNIELSVVKFATYVRPDEAVDKTRNWVLNGKKNSFYQYIIDRNAGSPTNGSINKTYTDLILGQGLSFVKNQSGSAKNAQDWAKLNSILKAKDLKRIATDFQVFGAASMQIQKNNKGELISISHIPKQSVVPAIENEDGEIDMYWHSKDWTNIFRTENTPIDYPAFGSSKEGLEIYVVRPYSVGMTYFESPDYVSGLQYSESEEEISNMYINSIKNGLSTGFIINVKNGYTIEPEDKKKFKKNVEEKLAGSSNGGSFIISFSGESVEVEVIPFPVNQGVHKQWEVLNDTCAQKILTSHRCPSPSIAGIISSSGFSNTAEEMDMAEEQLLKRVIAPKQKYLTDALEEILVSYDINLDLVFKPLTEVKDEAAPEVEMSSHVCMAEHKVSEGVTEQLISMGEDESSEWDLLCSSDVDYDTDDDLLGLVQFATNTGVARPNSKSSQDSEDIKIRYRYVGNPSPERLFCKKMISANKLYRKEDIIQMGSKTVNEGFGKRGTNDAPYSIWLHKGGGLLSETYPNGTCKHKWQREIYLKRGGGVDVNSPLAKTISTSESRRRGYKVPTNDSDVSITPHNNK